MAAATQGGSLGGLLVAGLIVFGIAHGCGSTSGEYHSHDSTVTNPDGSTTYTNDYDFDGGYSGSFSCTTTADYSSTDCSGTP